MSDLYNKLRQKLLKLHLRMLKHYAKDNIQKAIRIESKMIEVELKLKELK